MCSRHPCHLRGRRHPHRLAEFARRHGDYARWTCRPARAPTAAPRHLRLVISASSLRRGGHSHADLRWRTAMWRRRLVARRRPRPTVNVQASGAVKTLLAGRAAAAVAQHLRGCRHERALPRHRRSSMTAVVRERVDARKTLVDFLREYVALTQSCVSSTAYAAPAAFASTGCGAPLPDAGGANATARRVDTIEGVADPTDRRSAAGVHARNALQCGTARRGCCHPRNCWPRRHSDAAEQIRTSLRKLLPLHAYQAIVTRSRRGAGRAERSGERATNADALPSTCLVSRHGAASWSTFPCSGRPSSMWQRGGRA